LIKWCKCLRHCAVVAFPAGGALADVVVFPAGAAGSAVPVAVVVFPAGGAAGAAGGIGAGGGSGPGGGLPVSNEFGLRSK
jgi:hypothetical protein